MNERKRKNIIIITLCACITLMGIGYALLSQTLTINTTATINSSWDIRITNVEVANTVGYATDTTPDNNIADDGHSATVTTDLSAPGDTITYTVTVHNFGTIAGMYDVATQNLITPGDGQPSGVVTATTDVATSNTLKYLASQTGEGTFNVTLKFEDLDELPDVKEYSFTIAPNFIQTSLSNSAPDNNTSAHNILSYKADYDDFYVLVENSKMIVIADEEIMEMSLVPSSYLDENEVIYESKYQYYILGSIYDYDDIEESLENISLGIDDDQKMVSISLNDGSNTGDSYELKSDNHENLTFSKIPDFDTTPYLSYFED